MRRNPSRQASLFEADAAPSSAELLRIDQGPAALTPAQQTFNRLTEQIERARAKLLLWEVAAQRLHERVGSEMLPESQALGQMQRQLVLKIDELLSHPPAGLRLTRRRRDGLTDLLLERVDDLLAAGDDAALVALHDHYSDISLAARREVEARLDRVFAEQVAGEMFGDEQVGDLGEDPIEELYRRLDERAAHEEREREARDSQRKRGRRESAAQARREEEAQGARLSVREVYRKLVSSLHPDRESDPIERARKTALMQDINRAYQANDLLTLLRLQMDVEQIDAATLATLPEQRLKHYNDVLRDQLRTLQTEIAACVERIEQGFAGQSHMRLRDPKDADVLLNRQLRELREAQTQYRNLIGALDDPHRRLAEIDAIARAMAAR